MSDTIEPVEETASASEEARLLADVIKLKQHLVKIAKQGCDHKELNGVLCAEAGVTTPCGPCYATEVLLAEKSLDSPDEPYNVHLDGVPSQPGMIIKISRTDNRFPLITDDSRPQVAMQEMLLRFMGVLIDAYKRDRAFIAAAAKWGLTFDVDVGDVAPEAPTVA